MEEKILYKAVTEMNPMIYKDFYKFYFGEQYRTFKIVSTCIAAAALIAGISASVMNFGMMWILICLWIATVCFIYPRFTYRRPYKRARNAKQTTRFGFYENYVSEKTNGETSDYKYNDLLKVVETKKYIYIFHDETSISIVIKSDVKDNGSEGLCKLLKSKTKYAIKKAF